MNAQQQNWSQKLYPGGFAYYSNQEITFEQFVLLLSQQKYTDGKAHFGRGSVSHFSLENGVRVVLKRYRRGGLLGKVPTLKEYHTSFSRMYRSFGELEALDLLRGAGVRVPRPIAASVQRLVPPFYSAALATEELSGTKNLLQCLDQLTPELASAIGREARKSIDVGILPVDLHLGNVLVSEVGEFWLIDFDKARTRYQIEGACRLLTDRWARSVVKHGLGEALTKAFEEGVRAA